MMRMGGLSVPVWVSSLSWDSRTWGGEGERNVGRWDLWRFYSGRDRIVVIPSLQFKPFPSKSLSYQKWPSGSKAVNFLFG
jgi:hypothetical protein